MLKSRPGDGKYSIGNGFTYTHDPWTWKWWGIAWGSGGCWVEGGKVGKIGTTVIAVIFYWLSIKYNFKKYPEYFPDILCQIPFFVCVLHSG